MSYLKLKWQKNFFNVPDHIKQKLSTLKSNDIIVSCVKKIKKESISNGDYRHIGIKIENTKLIFPNVILPDPKTGRYSNYNINGRTIILKNLPKIDRSYSADSPNFGDWSKGSHTVTWNRKIYQRAYWLAQEIRIKISLLKDDTESFILKFSLDTPLSKNLNDFNTKLLYHCNLLQENCGACDIFESTASDIDYINALNVSWELLPPGQLNFNNNLDYIIKKTNTKSPDLKSELKDRMTFFEDLAIKKYIIGINSFQRYFGAILNNNIVILENIRYGNALYVFFQDWENLSKLSRIELLSSTSHKFTRIIHSKRWKTKVKQTIS